MKIGDFEIGSKPFIIAEAGINHNGSVTRAAKMVLTAKAAGCDAVKFQTFKADEFCRADDPLYPVFKKCELPANSWRWLKSFCDDIGIIFLSTPQNRSDLDLLLPLGIKAIKVGSDDFCNLPLLKDYASTGLPLILSAGMATWANINDAFLNTSAVAFTAGRALLVCTSQYPTPRDEVNIRRVLRLAESDSTCYVGFSDHTEGNQAAIMAVALGAVIFEKHFTLDKTMTGPDHAWSCNPDELSSYVRAIHDAWAMLGTGNFELSEREAEQKRKYQRQSGKQLRGA